MTIEHVEAFAADALARAIAHAERSAVDAVKAARTVETLSAHRYGPPTFTHHGYPSSVLSAINAAAAVEWRRAFLAEIDRRIEDRRNAAYRDFLALHRARAAYE